MRTVITTFILFGFSMILCAQVDRNAASDITIAKVDSINNAGFELWIRNPSESVNLGETGYKLANEIDYKEGQAFGKRVSGVAHWTLGEPKKALFDLYDGLSIYERLNDLQGASNTKLNIGMVYADLEEDSIATRHFEEAINGFTQLNLSGRIATTYTKLGTLQLDNGDYDIAVVNISNALKIHTRNSYEYGMAEAHNRLGRLYLDQNNLEQADYHLRQALQLSRKIDDKDGLVNNTLQFGRLFMLQNEFDLAQMHLELALRRARAMNLNTYRLEILKNLALLKQKTKQSDSALIYYFKYSQLKDSIFTLQKSRQIAGLEFRNELETKSQELILLEEKQSNAKTIQYILFAGIWIIGLLSIFLIKSIRQRSKNQKKLYDQQEIISKQELENQQLKSKDLETELDSKNRELTSYAMNFVQKNQLLEDMKEKVEELKFQQPGSQFNKKVKELEHILRINSGKEKDWEDFKFHFENVHPEFFVRLKQIYPSLSSNDLKIAALTRLGLSIKESANILGISPESTKTARYRLRKKLNLDTESDLYDFLLAFE